MPHNEEKLIRFTFSLTVATDGGEEVMERCHAWSAEIAEGMQAHHFAADDIDGVAPLQAGHRDVPSGVFPRWTGTVELLGLSDVG